MKSSKKYLNIKQAAEEWNKLLSGNDTFYLPVLGPVHVSVKNIGKLLTVVLENAKTNKFLEYDKNGRWFSKKHERIILSEIKINENEIIVPVVNNLTKACKIFFYSNNIPDIDAIKNVKEIFKAIKSKFEVDRLYFYSHQKHIRVNK
jgi:hypothetical protein